MQLVRIETAPVGIPSAFDIFKKFAEGSYALNAAGKDHLH